MRGIRARGWVVTFVLVGAGCTCAPPVGEEDAGLGDAGVLDAGTVLLDAGLNVDGGLDAGEPVDAGPDADAGSEDAGVEDAGTTPTDAGVEDAGTAPTDGGVALLTCTSCHGNELTGNAAPPRDTHAITERTARSVGAHQAHLAGGDWHRATTCDDCHRVPATLEAPGHLDAPPAELTFSAVANAANVNSNFDGVTCTTYCHGTTLTGGSLTQPDWMNGPRVSCYQCHGVPPPPPHPATGPFQCAGCHYDVFAQGQKHIDGHLDVNVSCTSCHGDGTSAAPPRDTQGNVATSLRTVGAHRSHLGPSMWHAEVTCDDCHVVPTRVDDPGHIDTAPAELHFGATAVARGAVPSWNGASCSNYCHGQRLDGGTNVTPTWTQVDGTQAACGSCHGLPPPLPHPQNPACSTCHGAVLSPDGGFVDPSLHINGQVEAQLACGSCHGVPPNTGTHQLHASLMGTRTYGSLATAASQTSPTGYAFGCGNCHPIDSARHMSGGRADIELYNPAAPPGSLKSRSPLATYTPGATVFTDAQGLSYTKGTCGSVYCHSGPAYATPNAVPRPGVDFTFAGYPVSYPAFALDVSRSYQSVTWGAAGTGCSGCHGFPIRTSEPAVHAGAGQGHSFLGPTGLESGHAFNHNDAPLPCRTCHYDTVRAANVSTRVNGLSTYEPVPIVGWAQHVNGLPDVAFDTVDAVSSAGRAQSLVGATYRQATSTCSSVSCHKSQSAVSNGHPFRPDQVSLECNACHQY